MITTMFPQKPITVKTRTLTTLLFTVGCLMLPSIPGAAQPAPADYQLNSSSPAALRPPSPFPPPPVGNPGTIPSGIVSPKCKAMPVGELMVECFLNENQDPAHNIPGTMVWYFPELDQNLAWSQWPAWAKHDLGVAFKNTVDWYNGGMVNYPGTLAADPLQNLNPLAWKPFNEPVVDGPTGAWPIYVGHIALNLASEIYGWVPWSLRNYDTSMLSYLFHHTNEFWWCDAQNSGANFAAFCNFGEASPTNAITTFKFLKQNNLIGANRIETIGHVLDWARNNLEHMDGVYTYANYAYIWQYLGPPGVPSTYRHDINRS